MLSRGECAGQPPSIFYPDAELDDHSLYYAEEVALVNEAFCQACPVRIECLHTALDKPEEWGIWGGVGRRERRSMLRRHAERGLALSCGCGEPLSPEAIRSKSAQCGGCTPLEATA